MIKQSSTRLEGRLASVECSEAGAVTIAMSLGDSLKAFSFETANNDVIAIQQHLIKYLGQPIAVARTEDAFTIVGREGTILGGDLAKQEKE